MCIFSALFREQAACPLLVLANRDESRSRPTGLPQRMAVDPTPWVGGLDLLAGGTWLGVNRAGLMVAITNRPKSNVPDTIRSRGLLCRELLAQISIDAARAELDLQRRRHEFAGFNLLLFSRTDAFVFEAGDEPRSHVLSPGIHSIANGGLNDASDLRVVRAQAEMETMARSTDRLDQRLEAIVRIAGLHADGDASPLCLHRNGSGTVSSTILAITSDAGAARYLYAPGPPCETPFADYSPLLQSLLAEHLP